MDKRNLVNKIKKLESERSKLRDEYAAHTEKREAEIKEHKRVAAECRTQCEEVKAAGAAKLAAAQEQHAAERRGTAARIAEYVKRINADDLRVRALEKELSTLQKAAKQAAAAADTLPALLQLLGLEKYRTSLEEEELDVPLLRSMGRDELVSNMAQLGMTADEAARLAAELFG